MSGRVPRFLISLLVLGIAAGASAQGAPADSPVMLDLQPEGGSPYRYVMELRALSGEVAEMVVDRRLLSLTVRPAVGRQRYRCRHPEAPRRVSEGRIRRPGEAGTGPVLLEWVDLRMYCTGRALRALASGGQAEVSYGFAGRGNARHATRAGRWIARDEEGHAVATRIDAPLLDFPAQESASESDDAVRVRLRAADVPSGEQLNFHVTVRAGPEKHARIYLRNDLVRFRVRGPLGDVECGIPRQVIVPIVDFFERLGARRAASLRVEAARYCPDETFAAAGIYEVTPLLDLPYGGQRYGLEAVTGSFEGPMASIRIRRGSLGYVEQVPVRTP